MVVHQDLPSGVAAIEMNRQAGIRSRVIFRPGYAWHAHDTCRARFSCHNSAQRATHAGRGGNDRVSRHVAPGLLSRSAVFLDTNFEAIHDCNTAPMEFLRTRFAVAQLGRKPGKRDMLATLVGSDDLPGGPWHIADQRTWRTGVTGPATPWSERARQAGSVTAWRSFRDASTSRWAWVQVTPLASAEDAGDALTGVGERTLNNLNTEVRLVSETDVPIEPFSRAGDAFWAREQHTDSSDGPGVVLMLAAAVSERLMVICLSGTPAWDWQSASELAAAQAALLPT